MCAADAQPAVRALLGVLESCPQRDSAVHQGRLERFHGHSGIFLHPGRQHRRSGQI
jgi:hypothetical protein